MGKHIIVYILLPFSTNGIICELGKKFGAYVKTGRCNTQTATPTNSSPSCKIARTIVMGIIC